MKDCPAANTGRFFLIGLMGSGKTTVGKALARRLEADFLDTDELIEAQAGIPISEIFAGYGEGYFRDLETGLLRQMAEQQREAERVAGRGIGQRGKSEPCGQVVVSVGGGLPVREENRELMRSLGTTVFLTATEETLYARLQGDRSRPLLQGSDLRERIRSLAQARLGFYRDAADVMISVDGKDPEEIAEEIIQYITQDRGSASARNDP